MDNSITRAGVTAFVCGALALCMLAVPAARAEDPAEDAEVLAEYARYEQATRDGSFDVAVDAAGAALARAETLYDDGHPTVAILTYHLGRALHRDGQRDASRDALQLALKRYRTAFGDDSADVANVWLAIGDAADGSGDAREAYALAVSVSVAAHGESSAAHVRTLLQAGSALVETHRVDTDAGFLARAYKLASTIDDAPAGLRAEAALELAKLRIVQQRSGAAQPLLLEATATDDTVQAAAAHALLVQVYESRGNRDAATPHALAVGRLRSSQQDDEYLPLYRVAPNYPMNALRAGRVGHVDFRFTVSPQGFVEDIEVTGGEQVATFRAAAAEAVRGFRYAPRFKGGEPVATSGVETRISFRIER